MSEQSKNSPSEEVSLIEKSTVSQSISPAAVGWGIVAFLVCILIVTTNQGVVHASIFTKILAVIVGSILGLIGALIGDAIRKIARPEGVVTSGGIFNILWIKLFWALGPQCIGLFLGTVFGVGGIARYL